MELYFMKSCLLPSDTPSLKLFLSLPLAMVGLLLNATVLGFLCGYWG